MAHATSDNPSVSPAIGTTYDTWFLGRKKEACAKSSKGVAAVCREVKPSWFLGRKQ
ncbi:hypothetical protein [Sulfurimonas diazotrophicus]|uniref:Uncharacterized protein n=1 Tax=Sulfurimonas diazotrophicus TaxID=3131939 RepID=A0ABZ3H8Q0_9BACT